MRVESDRLDQLAAAVAKAAADFDGKQQLFASNLYRRLGQRVNALNFPLELGSTR